MIHTPFGHFDQHLLNRFVIIIGINAVCGAELFCQLKLGWIGIDGKDAPRFCLTCALHHGQPDTAEAEYRHRIPFLYLRGIVYRADPGGHAAAEQANLLRIGLRIDFRQ
ncbi:Uncharacterised protein [Klebsiella pneumoniae]|nr:Uncharacterised protein [Klebsiella pneumoniae]VGF94576.1 Uncharacterised protein [Klebsiella pneumoniae]VGH02299.1 Uncharacterised protein [Klebsiella pneumoniae]